MTDTPEIARIRAALKAYDEAGYYDLPQCDELQDACSTNSIRRVLAHIDAQAAEIDALRAGAERYRWLMDNLNWQVLSKRIGNKAVKYRMSCEGDAWGQWHLSQEQAIDAAMKEKS